MINVATCVDDRNYHAPRTLENLPGLRHVNIRIVHRKALHAWVNVLLRKVLVVKSPHSLEESVIRDHGSLVRILHRISLHVHDARSHLKRGHCCAQALPLRKFHYSNPEPAREPGA